jgi:hypothetical protein
MFYDTGAIANSVGAQVLACTDNQAVFSSAARPLMQVSYNSTGGSLVTLAADASLAFTANSTMCGTLTITQPLDLGGSRSRLC